MFYGENDHKHRRRSRHTPSVPQGNALEGDCDNLWKVWSGCHRGGRQDGIAANFVTFSQEEASTKGSAQRSHVNAIYKLRANARWEDFVCRLGERERHLWDSDKRTRGTERWLSWGSQRSQVSETASWNERWVARTFFYNASSEKKEGRTNPCACEEGRVQVSELHG